MYGIRIFFQTLEYVTVLCIAWKLFFFLIVTQLPFVRYRFSTMRLRSEYDIFYHGTTAPSGPGPPHYWGLTITLRHTTLGSTHLDEWSARRRDTCLSTDTTLATDRHPYLLRVPNPRSQQASGRPRDHWDRVLFIYYILTFLYVPR